MHRLIRSSCPALQTKQSKQAKGESIGRHEVMHNISQWLWYLPHHRQGALSPTKETTEETVTSKPDEHLTKAEDACTELMQLLTLEEESNDEGHPQRWMAAQGLCRVCSPCPGRLWLLAIVRRRHQLDPLSALLAARSWWGNASWPRVGLWRRAAHGAQHQPHCLSHALPSHPFPSPLGSSFLECDLSFGSGVKPEVLANSSFFWISKRTPLQVWESILKTGYC